MSPSAGEVAGLLETLESPKRQEAAEVRAKLGDLFNSCKDGWLVTGLLDYQLATGSARVADLLAKAPAPHDKFLLDRAADLLRSSAPAGVATRTSILALLAHVVRKQPMWLHKLPSHSVFRELLHFLKLEYRPVPLLSGLLLLITLLPMIPTLISPYFQDIFEVFGRLAAWDGRGELDPHRDHLQLALYGLFQNLYAMFPCNFVDYLRREYCKRENEQVFTHTVRPMLESVRMHPLLITASKNTETDNSRWKKMEHHDVLVECRRFSSEGAHRPLVGDDDGRFRSRCGTDVSALAASSVGHFRPGKSSSSTPNLTESQRTCTRTIITTTAAAESSSAALISRRCEDSRPGGENWFSLSEACGAVGAVSAPQTPLPTAGSVAPVKSSLCTQEISDPRQTPNSQNALSTKQDGGSPPEAAIEATPENTPIKDTKQRFNFPNSPVVRALSGKLAPTQIVHQQYQAISSTISYSQPPSPLKKESSPLNRICSMEITEDRKDSFYCQSKLNKILHDRSQQTTDGFSSLVPSPQKQLLNSPLKKVTLKESSSSTQFTGGPSVPNSPVTLGAAVPVSGTTDWLLAKPLPHKDGVPFDPMKESLGNLALNMIDGVNREDKEIIELSKRGEMMGNATDAKPHSGNIFSEEQWAEDEAVCEEDHRCIDKLCSSSILEIARRVTDPSRFGNRYACEVPATGLVPFNFNIGTFNTCHICKKKIRLEKCMSHPEIYSVFKEMEFSKMNKTTVSLAGVASSRCKIEILKNEETQTIEVWPLGYEHLFTDILQNVYEENIRPSNVLSSEEKYDLDHLSYGQIDKYINVPGRLNSNDKETADEVAVLKQKLELVQLELLFEKHRREVHASRNRRLLGRSRKNRATEEQNVALRNQMSLLQTEIDDLRLQVTKQKQNMQYLERQNQENVRHWQQQLLLTNQELSSERREKERLYALLSEEQICNNETSVDVQNLRATLFDVSQQLQRAIRKSELGERHIEYIKQLQRELIMCGERDVKYKEILNSLPSKRDMLVNRLTQQYKEQLTNMQTLLQTQTSKMEYWQSREAELESLMSTRDTVIQDLKKQLRLVKEEYSEKLKAVEEKYQSVKRINQRMEAHCLELLQRVPQSPQTLSRDLTSGFSPQSSPLSASLASSEGQGPMLSSRIDEIRNLQVIVNAPETIEESTSNSINNAIFEDDTH